MSRNPKRRFTGLKIILSIIMVMLIAASAFMFYLCYELVASPAQEGQTTGLVDQIIGMFLTDEPGVPNQSDPVAGATDPSDDPSEDPTEETTEPTLPDPEHVVSTATIAATGDILMHMPVVNTGLQTDGSYDFSSIFRYLEPYSSGVDYAIANLETTLCGTTNGYPYHGYPNFNCPDEIAYSAADAGFDMLLTANNHSYDTGLVGYKRTVQVVNEAGMEHLGTRTGADEPKYSVVEINGIKIGMLCYTYAYSVDSKGSPSLNGMPHIAETGICNYFHSDSLDLFYGEVDGYLQEMEAQGAEATMMFIHWGVEYHTSPNEEQKAIAQKLCDLGIDVIVGGHPHVVQPVDLIQSTVDPEHKTVCLYSMGNAVSNQRQGNLTQITSAHTEDGVFFSVTFSKYSDGTVHLEGADLIPCWVNRHSTYGKTEYNILPLDPDTRGEWQSLYDLGDTTLTAAERSYDRTIAIVGDGLTRVQEYLATEKAELEQYYYDMVYHPERLLTEATEPADTTEPAA